ncbi:uncharacterized protein LOC131651377 [Vicia villosa]|uniref:uncharacterized protein LOC131651377 n=1 Tax=Vicia villosa TaxID=3911 RepID=UPI00273C2BA4|nr:uncharacterized protein LOC131651377 [Vicia villosa]
MEKLRVRIQESLKKGAADICFLQETKIQDMTEVLAGSFWGGSNVGWSAKNSQGFSGGILVLWNKEVVDVIFSFKGEGFLGICAIFKGVICYFVSVYSSCHIGLKRRMWEELLSLRRSWVDGEWCLGGDFNSIRCASERIGTGSHFRSQEASEFNDFIELMEVEDLPTGERIFSWCRGGMKVMSRIDRFLLSVGFIELISAESQEIGEKDISDHSPVWLKCNKTNWGPKPFRSLDYWLDHPQLVSFVSDEWGKMEVSGSCAFVIKEKLKVLRERLRWWNKTVFGWVDLSIDKAVTEINGCDDLVMEAVEPVNEQIFNDRAKASSEFFQTY